MIFNTIKDFEVFYNDYLDKQNPTRLIVKPAPTKFKLEKRKTVKEAVKEIRYSENGIPEEITLSPKETKVVPNTNAFTDFIIAYLKSVLNCKSARRISSEGRWRANKNHPKGGTWIPGQNKGLEDIQSIVNGKLVAIEVKYTKTDRLRDSQIARRNEVIADGGTYIVATDFIQIQQELSKL